MPATAGVWSPRALPSNAPHPRGAIERSRAWAAPNWDTADRRIAPATPRIPLRFIQATFAGNHRPAAHHRLIQRDGVAVIAERARRVHHRPCVGRFGG